MTGLMLRVGAGDMTPVVGRALTERVDFRKAVCPKRLPSGCAGGCATPLEAPRDARGGQDPWQGRRVRDVSLLMCDLQNAVVILKNAVSKRSWPDWREGAN